MIENMETAQPPESPTAQERAGMDWWNGLSEWGRRYWLERAGTAVPAEAWACYRAHVANTANEKAQRVWSGIEISGADLAIALLPGADGSLGVRVVALPSISGFTAACTLGSESFSRLRFDIADIQIGAASLECFAADPAAPVVREGFRAVIDPHMAAALKEWLPRLGQTAVLARAIATVAARDLGETPHLHYLHDFVSGLAALVILDGYSATQATDAQCSAHWAGKEAEFVAVLRGSEIQGLLESAAYARHQEAGMGKGAA